MTSLHGRWGSWTTCVSGIQSTLGTKWVIPYAQELQPLPTVACPILHGQLKATPAEGPSWNWLSPACSVAYQGSCGPLSPALAGGPSGSETALQRQQKQFLQANSTRSPCPALNLSSAIPSWENLPPFCKIKVIIIPSSSQNWREDEMRNCKNHFYPLNTYPNFDWVCSREVPFLPFILWIGKLRLWEMK